MVPVSNFSHVSSDLFLIAFMSMYKAEQIQFGNVIPKGNLINKTLKVNQESGRVILCEPTAALSHKQPHQRTMYSIAWCGRMGGFPLSVCCMGAAILL